MNVIQKCNFGDSLIVHVAGDLREPEVPAAEDREHGTQRQHVVEVRHHIIGVLHVAVDAGIGQNHARHTTHV